MPRLQRKESNLRENRLTAGCLTIRLRWNTWTEGHGADPWPSVVRRRVVNERSPARARKPISFGGRDRTCIAGSRGQRPAIGRPQSTSEGTRSPCRRRSVRTDLRLDRCREPRLFSRSQRRSEPAVHRDGRGVRMTWLGSNLLPPCSSTVRFDDSVTTNDEGRLGDLPGGLPGARKRWKYRLGTTLGVLEAAIAGRDARRKAIPNPWPRMAARGPHCLQQLGRGLPSHR
jgi:hypothetical protein